jgi:hypothetical protein
MAGEGTPKKPTPIEELPFEEIPFDEVPFEELPLADMGLVELESRMEAEAEAGGVVTVVTTIVQGKW